jgi:hypothetical protein
MKNVWIVFCFVLIAGFHGCVDDSFSSGDDVGVGVGDASAEDPFATIPDYGPNRDAPQCRDAVDLVFVLDVSSSMGFVLDKLKQEIGKVVTASNKLAPDSHFGLVAFVDNHRLNTTGALQKGVVHLTAATLSAAFTQVKAVYTQHNRNPGDGPNGPTLQNPICEENANDALYAAAAEFPWRTNSNRVVIVATDDTFLERPDNYGDRDGDGKTDKKDYPREGDYPAKRKLTETVDQLRKAKVRVFAFTRLKPPGIFSPTRCGTGRRLPWTSISDGWSTPYAGQKAIPAATGGKNFDLDQVHAGKLSLTETINSMVLESHCKPIE